MSIEKVSIDDIEQLKDLAKNTIIETVDASVDVKGDLIIDTANHIDRSLIGSDRVFLKYVDKAVSGFILVQKFWNLSDLFVLPSMQGNGIGSQLFDEAKAACAASGSSFIRVNSSLNAEGFYRSVGFVTHEPDIKGPYFVVPLIYYL